MKKILFFLIFIIFFILASFLIYGLGITTSSGSFLEKIDFEPGKNYTYNYDILTNDGYTADYEIFVETKTSLIDLRPYVKVEPNNFKDVSAGETRNFKVILNLPQKIESPGENEVNVWVRGIAKDTSGGLVARPVVGLRYLIYVLYPWKAVDWSISLPPMNLNDKQDFTINVENIGEPILEKIYADIEVYNIDNKLINKLKTNEIYNLKSKEKKSITASFDSIGLLAGEYYAIAYLHYDNNMSNKTLNFRIGQKNVKILNFTKLLEYNSINRFNIEVESEWNKQISNIYASVDIYDIKEKNKKLTSFRSFDNSLERLEKKTLEAYFDTKGFEKKEYLAVVTLFYEGSTTKSEDIIKIDENINAETVTEIPGRFSFKTLLSAITLINVLVFLLIVFVLISLYLVYTIIKTKNSHKIEKVEDDFDEDMIKKVKDLQKLFSDKEIKDKMIKKGWNPEKVDKLIETANKKKE